MHEFKKSIKSNSKHQYVHLLPILDKSFSKRWSDEEIERLTQAINKHRRNWIKIAEEVGNRSAS